jgi:mannosyl-3-phosphoglycerate phosphatase
MIQIIFTDLDGTLLDAETYSYEKALAAVNRVKQMGIPVIFCSAKTRAEQEVYRRKMGIFHPFIVENGGAIFIPSNYFPFPFDYHKIVDELLVIELGTPYEEIRTLLNKIKEEGRFHFRGFGDMSAEEVARESGLDLESAKLAKQREYDETVVITSPSPSVPLRKQGLMPLRTGSAKQSHIASNEADKFLERIKQIGLNWTHGGRFYEVMGNNDKGKAVAILSNLYRRLWGKIETIGLGDSLNDLPMLSAVDIPILVQKRDYTWENVNLSRLRKVQGVGPEGWSRAIEEILLTKGQK